MHFDVIVQTNSRPECGYMLLNVASGKCNTTKQLLDTVILVKKLWIWRLLSCNFLSIRRQVLVGDSGVYPLRKRIAFLCDVHKWQWGLTLSILHIPFLLKERITFLWTLLISCSHLQLNKKKEDKFRDNSLNLVLPKPLIFQNGAQCCAKEPIFCYLFSSQSIN